MTPSEEACIAQRPTPTALTVAGSDPSGGAGIQADLKTFHQLGVYGTSAITLVTVQNTRRVSRVQLIPADLVREQIESVFEDIPPKAVKTGALGSAEIIQAVSAALEQLGRGCALVVDPVMVSKHGTALIAADAQAVLRKRLLPLATLVTPNLPEAEELTGLRVNSLEGMREAALRIRDLGCRAVLVKGGHLPDEIGAVDVLLVDGQFHEFPGSRINTRHTHGTGCTYSAAITALLAKEMSIPDAVGKAKCFVFNAIQTAPGLGAGAGPVNHWAGLDQPL